VGTLPGVCCDSATYVDSVTWIYPSLCIVVDASMYTKGVQQKQQNTRVVNDMNGVVVVTCITTVLSVRSLDTPDMYAGHVWHAVRVSV
jgi:hypothetical protein